MEKGLIQSRKTVFVKNVEQLVHLKEIKLLRDEPNVDSGKI